MARAIEALVVDAFEECAVHGSGLSMWGLGFRVWGLACPLWFQVLLSGWGSRSGSVTSANMPSSNLKPSSLNLRPQTLKPLHLKAPKLCEKAAPGSKALSYSPIST